MTTYDEITHELIETPDLSAGYTYEGQRQTGTELQVLPGTVTAAHPEGLRHEVPVYEDCLYYHAYTEDELAAQHPPDDPGSANTAATWDELAAAYSEGVASV